jgi:hypothetical protein
MQIEGYMQIKQTFRRMRGLKNDEWCFSTHS